MTTTERFVRTPQLDRRGCCGDAAGDAWLDNATGHTVYAMPGWTPDATRAGRHPQPDLFCGFDAYDRVSREADAVTSHYGP